MDEKVLEVCFQIITYVGTAKSMYIDAIQLAKQGEFEQAKDRIKRYEWGIKPNRSTSDAR